MQELKPDTFQAEHRIRGLDRFAIKLKPHYLAISEVSYPEMKSFMELHSKSLIVIYA
jgi:hypothetical protein